MEAPTETLVLEWMTSLSNWGRWGADDQLGTLNLITPEIRVAAAGLVRAGAVVSCGYDIESSALPSPAAAAQRLMVRTGQGLFDEHRVPPPYPALAGRGASAIEYIGMVFHGEGVTHLDALGHMFWDGRGYNGMPAALVSSEFGATGLSVQPAAETGIVTRGVLLDLPTALGVERLPAGTAVTPQDLERAEAAQGIQVRSGDAVLLRTGQRLVDAADSGGNKSGWSAACLPWLHGRGAALIGCDTINDVLPPPYPRMPLPMHYIGIVAMGLWLVDNCSLDPLAAICAELSRYEFLFTLPPLRLVGGTGSPANPLAVF